MVGAFIYNIIVVTPRENKLKELEENERLLDREILRSIYATQKLTLFDKDGLRIKPFAQGILKQISELKFLLLKNLESYNRLCSRNFQNMKLRLDFVEI